MNLVWPGHSSFRIEIEGAVLLIDPWLTGNPMFPADRRAGAIQGVTRILLTHGHGDHIEDAAAIAKEKAVPVAGIYDLMSYLAAIEGVQIVGFTKGGSIDCNEGQGHAGQRLPFVLGLRVRAGQWQSALKAAL